MFSSLIVVARLCHKPSLFATRALAGCRGAGKRAAAGDDYGVAQGWFFYLPR